MLRIWPGYWLNPTATVEIDLYVMLRLGKSVWDDEGGDSAGSANLHVFAA